MSEQITNYKCPACTGPLHFNGETGKVECDYCGSSYSIEEIEKLYAEKDAEAAKNQAAKEEKDAKEHEKLEQMAGEDAAWMYDGAGDNWGPDGKKMKAYNCPSCGAELICDETTAATSCPYCGNPTMIPGTFTGALKPDLIIPFRLNKDKAISALKAHYQNKPLLPNEFSDQNHIEEIKGVYVPFWLFNGTADVCLDYNATIKRTFQEGGNEVTEEDIYAAHREGTVTFEKIPVDASSKMPDAHMDAIEPFDYSELKPFSMSYLPGFLADKYDVTLEDCAPHADERAIRSAVDTVANTVTGYTTVSAKNRDVRLHRGEVKYALLPVWLLSTRYDGKNYLFAMNGQTGKLIGDLPSSAAKEKSVFRKSFITSAIALTAVFTAISWFIFR